MNQWLALGTALVLGFVHSLELDHMVAVTAFVSRRPARAAALGFGLRWGIGHSIAVLAAGGVLLALGIRWTGRLDVWAEAAVGAMLVAVGLGTLRATRNLHLHPPAEHGDRTPLTAVGLVHGLAGTGAVVALVPVTLMDRVLVGIGYLLAFGIGATAGMVGFALVTSAAVQRAADRSQRVARWVAGGAGFASMAVGGWWVARALGG